jgi:hypothetical protein
MIDNGICYLTLTDKMYPKRLVFLFMEEIAKDFVDSLKEEHGVEYVIFNTLSTTFYYFKCVGTGFSVSRQLGVNMHTLNLVCNYFILYFIYLV